MAVAVTPSWSHSYARWTDRALQLNLRLPEFAAADTVGARVRLQNGDRTKTAAATIDPGAVGSDLVATFAPGHLADGAWQLFVSRKSGARFRDAGARVFVAGQNPIALLVGPAPATAVPPPVHTRPGRQRTAKQLGAILDRVLVEIPPAKADAVRSKVRVLARRIAGRLPR